MKVRPNGKHAGKKFTNYYAPWGEQFRSLKKVQECLAQGTPESGEADPLPDAPSSEDPRPVGLEHAGVPAASESKNNDPGLPDDSPKNEDPRLPDDSPKNDDPGLPDFDSPESKNDIYDDTTPLLACTELYITGIVDQIGELLSQRMGHLPDSRTQSMQECFSVLNSELFTEVARAILPEPFVQAIRDQFERADPHHPMHNLLLRMAKAIHSKSLVWDVTHEPRTVFGSSASSTVSAASKDSGASGSMSNVAGGASDTGAASSSSGDSQETKCSICFQTFTDPYNMRCKHTYCLECISIWGKAGGDNCPLCRRKMLRREIEAFKNMVFTKTKHGPVQNTFTYNVSGSPTSITSQDMMDQAIEEV